MTQERPWNKESTGAEFIKYLFALLFALLGVDVLEEEAKSNQPAANAA